MRYFDKKQFWLKQFIILNKTISSVVLTDKDTAVKVQEINSATFHKWIFVQRL